MDDTTRVRKAIVRQLAVELIARAGMTQSRYKANTSVLKFDNERIDVLGEVAADVLHLCPSKEAFLAAVVSALQAHPAPPERSGHARLAAWKPVFAAEVLGELDRGH